MICLIRWCRRSTSESIEPLGGIVTTNPNVRPVRHARQWIKKSLRQILRANCPITSTHCTVEPAKGSQTRKSEAIPGTDSGRSVQPTGLCNQPVSATSRFVHGNELGLRTIRDGNCASGAATPPIRCLPRSRASPGTAPFQARTMSAKGTLPIGREPFVPADLPQQWDFLPRTCPTQPASPNRSGQPLLPRLRERPIPHQRHPLRCRIRARMRRFLRPSFRRPFPVFFTPMLRLPLLLRV